MSCSLEECLLKDHKAVYTCHFPTGAFCTAENPYACHVMPIVWLTLKSKLLIPFIETAASGVYCFFSIPALEKSYFLIINDSLSM